MRVFIIGLISFYLLLTPIQAQNNAPKRATGGVCNAFTTYFPQPDFSKTGIKGAGLVNVRIMTDEEGNVESATALSGSPNMRPEAENAARKAKFKSAILQGKAVKRNCVLIYDFRTPEEKENPRVSGKEKTTDIGILNGRATYLPKPEYSEDAKNLCAAGKVEIEIAVDENGNVIEAVAVSGDYLLRESSVDAVKKAKFSTTGHPPQGVIKGIIVYNFDSLAGCVKLGIINKKAKFIPKLIVPKSCRCSGSVLVQVVIDVLSGKVKRTTAITGHPLLRRAAEESARKAIFYPTLINTNRQVIAKGFLLYKFPPADDEDDR